MGWVFLSVETPGWCAEAWRPIEDRMTTNTHTQHTCGGITPKQPCNCSTNFVCMHGCCGVPPHRVCLHCPPSAYMPDFSAPRMPDQTILLCLFELSHTRRGRITQQLSCIIGGLSSVLRPWLWPFPSSWPTFSLRTSSC